MTPEVYEYVNKELVRIIENLNSELRYEQKRNRKLQCQINRLHNLIPGRQRVWELNRIAMELDAEADDVLDRGGLQVNADGLRADALFIRRLEYDLTDLNVEKNGGPQRGTGKYDPAQWPRGERP